MPRSGWRLTGGQTFWGGGTVEESRRTPSWTVAVLGEEEGMGTRGECGFECYGVQTVTTIFRDTPEPQAEVSFIGSHVLFFPQPISKLCNNSYSNS